MKVNEGGFVERITMQISQTVFDDGSITILPDGGEECEYVRVDLYEQLEAENVRLSYLAYGPRHDADCPALWGAGNCKCILRERIYDWLKEQADIEALLAE